ncbi:MAG: hypothetical protein ABIR67_13800, partial [Gaiellaceae bacterium]
VSLVELGVPSGEPRCLAAAETVLAWLTGDGHRRGVRTIDGLVGEPAAQEAADRTAELFLEHRLFRTLAGGAPIHPAFVVVHYPPFWHYDVLQALVVLARMGRAGDPRAADGLELVERRRLADGRWRTAGRWWRPPGSPGSNVEAVDWGTSPSELVTLNALRVLRAARRLEERSDAAA